MRRSPPCRGTEPILAAAWWREDGIRRRLPPPLTRPRRLAIGVACGAVLLGLPLRAEPRDTGGFQRCEARAAARDELVRKSGAIQALVQKAQLEAIGSPGYWSLGIGPQRAKEQAVASALAALRRGEGPPEAVAEMRRILRMDESISASGCPPFMVELIPLNHPGAGPDPAASP